MATPSVAADRTEPEPEYSSDSTSSHLSNPRVVKVASTPSTQPSSPETVFDAPGENETKVASVFPGKGADKKPGNPKTPKKKGCSNLKDRFHYKLGPDETLPPLSKIEDIFADMVDKSLKLGLKDVIKHFSGRKLVVATMCSGTESPVLALQLISDFLQIRGFNFDFHHCFSAEIVPHKQAYIERNFAPPIIFRDVREFSVSGVTEGTTAYGGLVKIPPNVDILVAGFSCVDFSSLNTLKQSIDAGGESADTFRGIYNYAQQFRPPIIILENVMGAPWSVIKKKWAEINYTAEYLNADTKQYYIPHTRTRGYMLCTEDSAFSNAVEGQLAGERVATQWTDLMRKFKRKASCSIEEFLLDESDPRVIKGIEELSKRRGRAMHKVGWANCNGRHQDYRSALLLGQKRPLTNWQDGGSCKPTDQLCQGWCHRQVERVWDVMDISYLRNLNRGFDFQFKSRLMDLSQNVDRNTDSISAGIASCITPNGIPFSTIRGGPIIGLEALALQGIPIDRLQLTRETQSQLQDLAGNAMSSTVVGAAILSALIAGYSGLRQGNPNSIDVRAPAPLSNVVGEPFLNLFNLDLDLYKPLGVKEAEDVAAQSVRLCVCEGRKAVTETALQECSLCLHTTCIKCGGNPSHHYAPLSKETSLKRILPEIFTSFIKKGIPMRLQITGVDRNEIHEISLRNKDTTDKMLWELSIEHIIDAVSSELRFHSTKRADFWTIYYHSEHARMELVVMSNRLEWHLYAKPPPTAAVDSVIRKLLTRPIACMRPTGDDLTQGLWQLWLPKQESFYVNIAAQGDLTRSFESIQGLRQFEDDMVWTEYKISIPEPVASVVTTSIVGTYRLSQDCGMASGSLHVQKETLDLDHRIFFFLDPHILHEPSEDSFIFSLEKRHLNFGEKRQAFATLDPSWRPPILQKANHTGGDQTFNYRLKGTKIPLSKKEAQAPTRVKCFMDGRWTDLPKARFRGSRHQMDSFRCVPANFAISSNLASCGNTHAVFSCETSMPPDLCSDWKRSIWIELSQVEQKEFFTGFAWITEKACRLKGLGEWRRMPPNSEVCPTCAPNTPRIKWRVVLPKAPKNKSAVSDTAAPVRGNAPGEKDVSPDEKERPEGEIEDGPLDETVFPDEMGHWAPPGADEFPEGFDSSEEIEPEKKIVFLENVECQIHPKTPKLVPFEEPGDAASFELQLKSRPRPLVTQIYIDEKRDIKLKIAFNPMTLIHRAAARLSSGHSAAETSWRLVTDHGSADKFSVPKFRIPCNKEDPSAINPPRFKINLRPEQLQSLWWMIKQESDESEAFVEEEVEEVVIPELRWRGEGRATKSVMVKGGVLADEVGYGKTATTLALIESRRERDHVLAKSSSTKGHISLKATLIFVPPQLPDQWLREITKFLKTGHGCNVMVLKNLLSLQKKTVADFQRADIIVASWKFFENEGYLSQIAHFSGMVELPKSASTRAAAVWYGQALAEIAEHAEILKDGGTTLNDLLESKLKRNEEEAGSAETFVPSRRFRGQQYHAQKEKAAAGAKRKHEMISSDINVEVRMPRGNTFGLKEIAKGKSWTTMKCPLLEIFEFARVVIDEYTYVNGRENLTVLKLKAHHRWILSATPPLQDFADIKRIAQYLGVNLGVDDVSPGVISASNIHALERDKTDSEKFRSYEADPSVVWHENRVKVAQRFLDQFVRRNIADIKAIPSDTHILPVLLPAPERAIYLELNSLLVASDFNIKRFLGDASNARMQRTRDLILQSSTAAEALVKSASQFTFEQLDNKMKDPSQVCDTIVKVRSLQYHQTMNDIAKAVKMSEWLSSVCNNPTQHYAAWKSQVSANHFGDLGVMSSIKSIIATAEAGRKDDDWKEFYLTAEQMTDQPKRAIAEKAQKRRKCIHNDLNPGCNEVKVALKDHRRLKPEGTLEGRSTEAAAVDLRQASNQIRKLLTEAVIRTRCLRFFLSVRETQEVHASLRSGGSSLEPYTCSKCQKTSESAETIWILIQCGHRVCTDCKKEFDQGLEECPCDGCNAINRAYQVIKAKELDVEDDTPRTGLNHGKKIEKIVDLIRCISCEDQILIFIQFPSLAPKITAAFDEAKITYMNLGGLGDPSKRLTEFQTDRKKETRKQVLILNIGDELAAGSNLTNANHVIFVSPYLTDSQQRHDHARAQAMGRACRFGQMKAVHVYDFVALNTIDVDILQMRSKKILKKNDAAPVESTVQSPNPPFESFISSGFELVERDWGNTNTCGEFGSPEVTELLISMDDF